MSAGHAAIPATTPHALPASAQTLAPAPRTPPLFNDPAFLSRNTVVAVTPHLGQHIVHGQHCLCAAHVRRKRRNGLPFGRIPLPKRTAIEQAEGPSRREAAKVS